MSLDASANEKAGGTRTDAKQSGNIFNDAPLWPQLAQDPLEFKPETAAFAPKTGPVAGHAEVLAGESAVDEVNIATGETSWRSSQPFSVGAVSDSDHVSASSGKCGRVHFANVIDALYLRPVTLEHAQAPRILFDLHDGLDARALKPKLESPGTAE